MSRVGRKQQWHLPPRPTEGRLVAGVCAGLARQLNLDVTLVRLTFLALALAWGVGLVAYGILWLILPDVTGRVAVRFGEGMGDQLAEWRSGIGRSVRSFPGRLRQGSREGGFFHRKTFAGGLMVAGLLVLLASLGAFGWLTATRALGLALIVLGGAFFLGRRTS